MEIEKSDILYIVFLNEVHLLRQQKGKYLCADFCPRLENLSLRIAEEVYQDFKFAHDIPYQFQPPEKISDNLIDLCLECIEIDLQKLNYSPQDLEYPKDTEVSQILLSISYDLKSLAACLRFTINSNNHIDNYHINFVNKRRKYLCSYCRANRANL